MTFFRSRAVFRYNGGMRRTYCPIILLLLALPQSLCADVFHLNNGGRLVGCEVDDDPAATDSGASELVTIDLDGGGRVQIERACISKREGASQILGEYQRRVRAAADTIEGHWELAEWCRIHRLKEQRAKHLQRILELDSEHIPARRALGYYHHRGQWVTREQVQQRAGYVMFQGRWRTPQEVELILERKAARAAHIEWTQRLKRWRRDLIEGDARESALALENFSKITDPVAIDPLTGLICSEPVRELKLMYIRVLCRIPHPRAVHQLTYLTLVDRDEDVFDLCMREVVQRRQPETLKAYTQALQNLDNFCVNRAARALLQLEDPSTIGPLIDALITTHPVATPRARTPAGVPASGSTITFAQDAKGKTTPVPDRKPPPVIFVRVPNQDVLAALVQLSDGLSFGFDQPSWSRWHAAQRQRQTSVATVRAEPSE